MKHATNNDEMLFALSRNLIRAREENNMKQEAAAKDLNISRSTLSKYENGNLSGLTIDCLLAMSKLYRKTLPELFPNEPGITFIFNPSDGAQYNTNQQAYTLHTQSEGFREMIAHLQDEIKFLRSKIKNG